VAEFTYSSVPQRIGKSAKSHAPAPKKKLPRKKAKRALARGLINQA
jgi:hypothetical protein